MTNIIETIENNSLNNNKMIKENSLEIIEKVKLYGSKKTELKSDDFRNWITTNKQGKQFSFLFDTKGKKDKLVMSQHSKNISNGLMAIYKTEFVEETLLFQTWALDEEYLKGNNVSSFTKMSANLTAYSKHLNPTEKAEETEKAETEKAEEIVKPNITLEQLFDYLETLNNADLGLTIEHALDLQKSRIKKAS